MRNTARYLLGNLAGFEPQRCVDGVELLALDRWAVAQARELQGSIEDAYHEYNFHLIYQKLHQFCVVDMGGFYLDVLKDRLYTMPGDSLGRRSAQTAMYHILNGLVRWMAPILSFTAEEIWQQTPGRDRDSIFLTTWYGQWPELPVDDEMGQAFWADARAVRQEVGRQLEVVRTAGGIGSALEAEVTVYCGEDRRRNLDRLGDELRFVLITSGARLARLEDKPDGLGETELDGVYVAVHASRHEKCIRCWHRRPDIGQRPDHPLICTRCVDNITGAGEQRRFA